VPLKVASSVVPGIQTYVSDKSTLNLPTNIDREKESVLPPGSATPGSGGRDIGKFENNTPDNGIPERPRTTGVPGDEYGSPHKNDYNMPTRRTMTASRESVARLVEAWKRQRRRRGPARTKARQYYQKNRARILARNKAWRRRNQNNPRVKRNRAHYRKFPGQHKRLAWEAGPPTPVRPQRRLNPAKQRERRRYYQKNRRKIIRNSKRRYHQFCKHNKRCMHKRRDYRSSPLKFKRRSPLPHSRALAERRKKEKKKKAAMITEVGFSLAPDMVPGFVKNLNPETWEVTFELIEEEEASPEVHALPLSVFIELAVFYTDEDAAEFFELVDSSLGIEAYEELNAETVSACAELYGFSPEGNEFGSRCEALVGKKDLYQMNVEELRSVLDLALEDEHPEEMISRVAGQIIMYDQESPDREVKQPGKGVPYEAEVSGYYHRSPVDRDPAAQMPDNQTDNVPAGSSRVVPNGTGQLWSGEETYMKSAATIAQLLAGTDGKIRGKANEASPKLKRADPKNGIWLFEVAGTKGSYLVRVKGVRSGNIQLLEKAQVLVSCTCDFFRWQGPEHWAKAEKYLYGKPVGTASTPSVKDPSGKHKICKHLAGVFTLARKYRFASTDPLWWDPEAEVLFGE
jgi:hypothetical protein